MNTRPVVYLLPGLLCDQEVWSQQASALESFAQVRIPDFRGYDSLKDMANSVLQNAPQNFAVVGHSMGGRIALEIVNLAANRVSDIVLMSVGAHPVTKDEIENRMALVELAEESGMQALANTWARLMIQQDYPEDTAMSFLIQRMVLRNTLRDFKSHILAGLNRDNQSLYLPHIRQKVLLICGDQDHWSPVSQHESIQKLISNAEIKIVKGAGHMLTLDNPEKINRLLVQWLFNQ